MKAQTGLSRSKLYDMMAKGHFPKPIKLGERAVGWSEAEVGAWIEGRMAMREAV